MAGSVNKVILIGNLGRDPESRSLQNGGSVVSFSIATSESWSDKQTGEKREKVQWHRIVIWNENIGKIAEKYLRKGSKAYIEGQLETRKYTDKDGHERETTEVVLSAFRGTLTLLGDPPDSGNGDRGGGREQQRSRPAATTQAGGAGAGQQASWEPSGGDLDDEIPF